MVGTNAFIQSINSAERSGNSGPQCAILTLTHCGSSRHCFSEPVFDIYNLYKHFIKKKKGKQWCSFPLSSQVERSTWCAGTRTRQRRRGLILSRRREIKYSMIFFKTHGQTLVPQTWLYSKWLVSLQEVYVHILDLSETKKVWEFAEAFKRKYKALNVLVSRHESTVFIFGNIWQCVIRLLSKFYCSSLCQCWL